VSPSDVSSGFLKGFLRMDFIDLYFALQSVTARIEPSPDPEGCNIFVPAGKMSQSSANNFHNRVAPGIDMANRVSKAARSLNEALQDSKHQKPNLFEYDGDSACSFPAGKDTWSRMKTLLLQAMFWGNREKRYCVEHFRRATTKGEYFLRGPIERDETDAWLTSNGNALQPTSFGFDSDELFSFLDANGIPYMFQHRSYHPGSIR
jgi:hypothetical protein